jgi:hypothetical protein
LTRSRFEPTLLQWLNQKKACTRQALVKKKGMALATGDLECAADFLGATIVETTIWIAI